MANLENIYLFIIITKQISRLIMKYVNDIDEFNIKLIWKWLES